VLIPQQSHSTHTETSSMVSLQAYTCCNNLTSPTKHKQR